MVCLPAKGKVKSLWSSCWNSWCLVSLTITTRIRFRLARPTGCLKKGSRRFKAHLKALNGLKSKVEENIPTPIKIQCQLLGGVLKAQKWGFCFLPLFDLSPFKSSKWALNLRDPFFWDTLYVFMYLHSPWSFLLSLFISIPHPLLGKNCKGYITTWYIYN